MRNESVRFEEKDIRPVAVIATGLGVLIGTIATVFLIWFVFEYYKNEHAKLEPRAGVAPVFEQMRKPVLQTSPARDLQELHARDRQILEGYNWVDRDKKIVSIPIESAMETLVRRGMPATGDYSDLKLVPPRGGSRQTGF